VEENAAYVARGHYELLEEICGAAPERIKFVGGPARGKLWPQIVADVLGVPVETPTVREATSFGAALCALVGAGVYPDLASAAAATAREPSMFWPDAAAHAIYDAEYARWQALNAHQIAAADAGLTPHLWRGAGA
jgi:autoinducer 2 (AI-2) kinase